MKGTLIVEFEYDEEAISLVRVEKDIHRLLVKYASDHAAMENITHLEAAPGDMEHSFGIGGLKK